MTRVFPLPAAATISKGPSTWVTACRCGSVRSRKRESVVGEALAVTSQLYPVPRVENSEMQTAGRQRHFSHRSKSDKKIRNDSIEFVFICVHLCASVAKMNSLAAR
jgi:hypothetical protein